MLPISVPIESPVCGFPLVINTNLHPNLHSFQVIGQICIFDMVGVWYLSLTLIHGEPINP